MDASLLEILACPRCGGNLGLEGEHDSTRIDSGSLRCTQCGSEYAIDRGVPLLNVGLDGLESIARSFGYEWRAHHRGVFEDETLFGRTVEEDWSFLLECLGAEPDELRGKVVLDAGCGSGRFTRLMGEHGAKLAVGVDINDAVHDARRATDSQSNVEIVQANIFSLPFKPGVFDYIWCSGVIHHTPDAAAAFRALAPKARPGGTVYVWVYAKRFNPFRFVKTVFDAARVTRLPEPVLLVLAKTMSYPSYALLQAYRGVRALPGLRAKSPWALRTVRPRNLGEIQLTWFDAISPAYDSRHTEAEVIGWFERAAFERIEAIVEPKVGVRGRATSRTSVENGA